MKPPPPDWLIRLAVAGVWPPVSGPRTHP